MTTPRDAVYEVMQEAVYHEWGRCVAPAYTKANGTHNARDCPALRTAVERAIQHERDLLRVTASECLRTLELAEQGLGDKRYAHWDAADICRRELKRLDELERQRGGAG